MGRLRKGPGDFAESEQRNGCSASERARIEGRRGVRAEPHGQPGRLAVDLLNGALLPMEPRSRNRKLDSATNIEGDLDADLQLRTSVADQYPIFDPIRTGAFSARTPLTYQRRAEEECVECNAKTPHDYYEAIVGWHVGFSLPFGRKSTAGKLGTRSHWAFCAVCGTASPLDAPAFAALQQAGIATGKAQLPLEEVARQLALQISHIIAEEPLQELSQFGVDPANGIHKQELLLLGLHALRVAAQQSLGHQESVTLIDYTGQLVRALFTGVLKYPAEAYEVTLVERFAEYDEIITRDCDPASKLQAIGIVLTRTLGSRDAGLILWATEMYAGWMKANVEFLARLRHKYELIP